MSLSNPQRFLRCDAIWDRSRTTRDADRAGALCPESFVSDWSDLLTPRRRHVDERFRDDRQLAPDLLIELVHRPRELLDLQGRGGTHLGEDNGLLGCQVERFELQDLL